MNVEVEYRQTLKQERGITIVKKMEKGKYLAYRYKLIAFYYYKLM